MTGLAGRELGGPRDSAAFEIVATEPKTARHFHGRSALDALGSPCSRVLVAETLERRWNAALERVQALEARLAAVASTAAARVMPDMSTLRHLAEDFPRVWAAPSIDIRLKKRIVRLLIEEMIATTEDGPPPQLALVIHWKGGQHTRLMIPRNRKGQHRYMTDRAIIEVVRALAAVQPDAQIARILNRLGYRTGAGNTWTQSRVISLRSYHQIPGFHREGQSPTALTLADAAKILGLSTTTVRRLITLGLLPATQPVLYAPWTIGREAVELEAVQRAVMTIKGGGALPNSQ